jgi:hypothetical protein
MCPDFRSWRSASNSDSARTQCGIAYGTPDRGAQRRLTLGGASYRTGSVVQLSTYPQMTSSPSKKPPRTPDKYLAYIVLGFVLLRVPPPPRLDALWRNDCRLSVPEAKARSTVHENVGEPTERNNGGRNEVKQSRYEQHQQRGEGSMEHVVGGDSASRNSTRSPISCPMARTNARSGTANPTSTSYQSAPVPTANAMAPVSTAKSLDQKEGSRGRRATSCGEFGTDLATRRAVECIVVFGRHVRLGEFSPSDHRSSAISIPAMSRSKLRSMSAGSPNPPPISRTTKP